MSDCLDSGSHAQTREYVPLCEDITIRAGGQIETSSGRVGDSDSRDFGSDHTRARRSEPVLTAAAPVVTGASSGQRRVGVSVSPTPGQRSFGELHIAPVFPGVRVERGSSGHRSMSERRGETALSCTDPVLSGATGASPGRRSDDTSEIPAPGSRAHTSGRSSAARQGGRPTRMSSRSSRSVPGQPYRDSISALAVHVRSTAESVTRLLAPTRQRPHPRS